MIPHKRFDIFPPDWGMLRRSRCVQINNSINQSVAPVVRLVTSKPSDVGTPVRISVPSLELVFFLTKKEKKKKKKKKKQVVVEND